MKPFTFSLQAIRTLRQRQEQLALEAFGVAVRARQAAMDRQQAAERELAGAFEEVASRQQKGATLYHLNQVRGHAQWLEHRLATCRAECQAAQATADEAWEKLQDIRQALELVDKLWRRQREQYERALRDEEQKQLDEMSGRRGLVGPAATQPTIYAWN